MDNVSFVTIALDEALAVGVMAVIFTPCSPLSGLNQVCPLT